ncbi:MAG TPA: glycosyltransferase family 4 protein [Steroidobacteraceae bacterium]|nr:glycosyltransferase family 4 protein [Steroidobacteraceae bacterium]
MRILIAAPTFGVYGGIEVFATTLAEWLHQNSPHEVRVCLKLVGDSTVAPPLQAHCAELPVAVTFVRRGSRGLARAVQWADLVHSNTCSPDIALLTKAMRKPLVLTVHNWFRGRHGMRNRLWYLCNRLADWRTYNSQFVRDTWEPQGALPRGDLIPTVSRLPSAEVRPEERRGFFFIARLIENKGADILAQAYLGARIDHAQWPLTIAGDGPLRSSLEAALGKQGRAIEFPGFIAETDKVRRMAAARWLVSPANTREDMGLTPIEARSVGVPAIVSRDGGLPEAGGPTALVCEAGSVDSLRAALEQAAAMPAEEYRQRASGARDSLRTYLRPMSDYVAIYREVSSHRGLTHSRTLR